MATWPVTLPDILVQGYSATNQWNILETTMESGPKRRTRMSAHYMINGVGNLMLDKTQMAALYATLDAANDGADWITGVRLDMGQGPAAHRARITGFQVNVVVPELYWRAILWWETDERNFS
jgi:hypothetical protein